MFAHPRLSSLVSFRTYEDRAVLANHANGDLHLLNVEGGEMLARLAARETGFTEDEQDFLAQLASLGVLESPVSSTEQDVEAPDEDLLDELNRWAADALVPLHCQLELTYRCALRCRHCYLGHVGSDPRQELSTEEVTATLDALASLGCFFLLLTGGEPFLRADFEEIFCAARERRFAVSLATSGWKHDPALLSRLARRGIDCAQVSLYGPDAPTHDAMTGTPGSFVSALSCMRTLRDLGVRVRAAVTPTRLSIDRIEEMKRLLDRERIPAALGLYMAPRRNGDRQPQTLTVDEDGLCRALNAFPPDTKARLSGLELDDKPCGCGANTLCINPYGVVHPCLQLQLPAGSLRDRPIQEIWNNSEVLASVRRVTLGDLEDCPACSIRNFCNRCAGFAHAEKKSILSHCSFDCLQAKSYIQKRSFKET